MSLARDSSDDAESSTAPRRINLHIPSSLLILPTSAAFVGLAIGMSRGGSRARLRFLAENAHRQPRTVQGWYFYTKTRNYRVFFAAAKTGAKYALGLGSATAGFVLLKESFGWVRERAFDHQLHPPAKSIDVEAGSTANAHHGWLVEEPKWMDGALAGASMGGIVGSVYRLHRPLFVRALLLGAIMGGSTSALEMAQAHIGKLRAAELSNRPASTGTPPNTSLALSSHLAPELGMIAPDGPSPSLHDVVDRPLSPGEPAFPDPTALKMGAQRGWYDPRRWLGM